MESLSGRICCSIFLAISCFTSAMAIASTTNTTHQWVESSPPGGLVDALVPDGKGGLFMTSEQRLYFSDDAGESWALLSELPWYVADLRVDTLNPSHLLAAVQYEGVMQSEDGGKTWKTLGGDSNNPLSGLAVTSVARAPGNPDELYAGTWDAGIYVSTDGGASWAKANAQPGNLHIKVVRFSPKSPSVLYAGTEDGLYRSTDGGASWQIIPDLPSDREFDLMVFEPSNPDTILAAGNCCISIYKSIDGGNSWAPIAAIQGSNGGTVEDITFDPADPTVIYAAAGSLYRLHDGDGSWTALPDPDQVKSADASAIYRDPTNPARLVLGTNRGIFISDDTGSTWSPSNTGFSNADLWYIAPDPATADVIYGASPWQGVFRSDDGGQSWQARNGVFGDTDMRIIAPDPSTPGTIYTQQAFENFYSSHDGGKTWNASTIDAGSFPNISALLVDPNNPDILYARDTPDSGVLKSSDGGAHWTLEQSGLPDFNVSGPHFHTLVMSKADAKILYLGTVHGVYKSIDAGLTWQSVNNGISSGADSYVSTLAIDPTNPSRVFAGIFDSQGFGHLWRTTDGGSSWQELFQASGDNFAGVIAIALDPQNPRHILVGDRLNGLFASIDGGDLWVSIDKGEDARDPFGNYSIKALYFDPFVSNRYYAIVGNHPSSGDTETSTNNSSDGPTKAHLEIFSGALATNLSVTIAKQASPPQAGDKVTTGFSVINKSDVTATNVKVTLEVNGDVTIESATLESQACSVNGDSAECSLSKLTGGATAQGALSYRVSSAGNVSITAAVTSDVQDDSTSDNKATEGFEVADSSDVAGSGKGDSTSGGGGAWSLLAVLVVLIAWKYRQPDGGQ
ncbi:MAG TPA: hypothetical protein VFK24_02870 [Gammaproteobacteria bacterium]|nr:hypothetical protein [Gammaproteobacteria bacterium]